MIIKVSKTLKNSKNKMSKIIWFTGMSGSGKSYYSDCIKEILKKENLKVNVIDGDIIRDKYKSL